MLNLVLFGPPGAGKGTQSQKLIDAYGLTHLSTGDLLRSEIARGTTLGLEAKQIMDRGDLVSDEIVIGMIESKIDSNPHAKGFIFDGFPRTQAQAIALDDLLQKKGTAISAMLALEVDNEELVKRLLLRGKDSGRPDDQNEDIIRNRVNEYNNKTLPLKKYYSEQAKFHSINGIGTVDGIFKDLQERIVFINAEIELTNLENDIEHLDLTINDFEVATEISDELKKDIEDVRKAEGTKKIQEPRQKKKETKKQELKGKKQVAKKTAKSASKKVAKKTPLVAERSRSKKAVAKKVVVKKKPIVKTKAATKKVTKKVVAKKPAKKVVVKAKPVAKKAAKKSTKKAVSKASVTNKKAVKKVVKKTPATKKKVTKVIAKKPTKKVAAKKVTAVKKKKK